MSYQVDPVLEMFEQTDFEIAKIKNTFDGIYTRQIGKTPEIAKICEIFEINPSKNTNPFESCPDHSYRILQECMRKERPDLEKSLWQLATNMADMQKAYMCDYEFEALLKSKISLPTAIVMIMLERWNQAVNISTTITSHDETQEVDLFIGHYGRNHQESPRKRVSVSIAYGKGVEYTQKRVYIPQIPDTLGAAITGKLLSEIIDCPHLPEAYVESVENHDQDTQTRLCLALPEEDCCLVNLIKSNNPFI